MQNIAGQVSTDLEIKEIRAEYPDAALKEGMVIGYDKIEAITGLLRASSRFKTITRRWRKLVEQETRKVVILQRNGQFIVADNDGKISTGNTALKSAVKKARRAFILTARVDTTKITDVDKSRLLLLQRNAGAILAADQAKASTQLPTLESSYATI